MTSMPPTPWADRSFNAPALVVANFVVSNWARLYTLAAPGDERAARRAEILSDLHDQIAESHEEGIGPTKTAVHMLARMVMGMLDDVMWAGRQGSAALNERLKQGSDAIGVARPSPLAISSLGMLGLMNWALAMSGQDHPWFQWVAVNAAVLIVGVLLLKQRHLGVPSPSRTWNAFAGFLAVAFTTWAVLGPRLEQAPGVPQLAFDAAIGVLLVVSGTLVIARVCKVNVSWGAWWPVWLSWVAVGIAAWGTAASTGGALRGLGELSLATALACTGWMVLAAIFGFASKAACYGGLMGSARCIRWFASGIQPVGR